MLCHVTCKSQHEVLCLIYIFKDYDVFYSDWNCSSGLAVNDAAESRSPELSVDEEPQGSALFVFLNSFREAAVKVVKMTQYVSLHSPYY
jgi:hypothetical protein